MAVLIEAEHQCMSMRGVRQPGVKTITTRFTGALETDASYRDRFLQMVHGARAERADWPDVWLDAGEAVLMAATPTAHLPRAARPARSRAASPSSPSSTPTA